jgi:carbohydrate-binding DOMON domain-containing protein
MNTGKRLSAFIIIAMIVGLLIHLPFTMSADGDEATPGEETRAAEERLLFEMRDPIGDDYGPGGYVYPLNQAFAPHKGLFDLIEYKVFERGDELHFDLTFGEVTNPWNAPEGFCHQKFDIYIDTTQGIGRTDAIREGANVIFHPDYGWEYLLRGSSWGDSRLYRSSDPSGSEGERDGVKIELLPDGVTVRLSVKREYFKEDQLRDWRYYVLVGSQDAFGPDNYRPVMMKEGQWVFGGGDDSNIEPNIIDLLAPEKGEFSQEAMLSSYNLDREIGATIYPVGVIPAGSITLRLFLILAGIILLLAAVGIFFIKSKERKE